MPPSTAGNPTVRPISSFPRHAGFVGAHVGPEDVVLFLAQRVSEGTDEPFLLFGRHAGLTEEHGFAAAVREAGRRVLQRHRTSQPGALLGADIGSQAQAADRGPAGNVVDDEHALETERRLVYMDDLRRTQLVRIAEDVFHYIAAFHEDGAGAVVRLPSVRIAAFNGWPRMAGGVVCHPT
jgi:hypothetical protein